MAPFIGDLRLAHEGGIGRTHGDLAQWTPHIEAAEIECHLRLILKICSPSSFVCERKSWPCSLQKCGMSMTAAGSVAMTLSVAPEGIACSRLRALSTGKGQSSPRASSS